MKCYIGSVDNVQVPDKYTDQQADTRTDKTIKLLGVGPNRPRARNSTNRNITDA